MRFDLRGYRRPPFAEWLDATVARFDSNRLQLARLLEDHAPGIGYTAPEATYLAWLDFRGTGLPRSPERVLEAEAGIVVSAGSSCGPGGDGHVRFNFAMEPDLLERSVRRIGSLLESLRGAA